MKNTDKIILPFSQLTKIIKESDTQSDNEQLIIDTLTKKLEDSERRCERMRTALLKIRKQNGWTGDGNNGPLSYYIAKYIDDALKD